MHSLSLKVFTDFNGTVRRSPLGRGSYGGSDLDFGSRRVGGEFNWRGCRVMASASERNGNGGGRSRNSSPSTASSSFLSRTQTYALLKQQMEVAAKSEVSLCFGF